MFEVADGHGGVDHGDQPADVRLPRLRDALCQVAAQIPGQSLAQLSLYAALQQAEQNALSYTAVTSMSVCLCVCVCTSVRWPPRSLVRVSPSCRSTRRYNKQNRTHLVIQQSLPCLSVCVCVYLRQVATQIPGQSLAQLSLYAALQQAEQNALSYTAVTSMSVCLCVCVYLRQVATQIPGQSLAQLSLYAALQQAEQNALSYTAVTSMSVCLCVCVPPSGGRPDPWSESRPVVALRCATTSRTERT